MNAGWTKRRRVGWRRWWPFGLLCVAAFAQWNVSDSVPGATTTLASDAWACVLLAVACFFYALIARVPRPEFSRLGFACFAGALLLCGPQAALFLHATLVAGSGTTLALALVPVVAAVASGAGRNGAGPSAALLWPGIASVAGLLLLLPQPGLLNARGDVAMLLMAVLTGVGCVLMRQGEPLQPMWRAAGAFAGASLAFCLGAVLSPGGIQELIKPGVLPLAASAVLDGLAVFAVLRLRPLQYAARYTLVPLALLLEGLVLLRPPMGVRSCGGIVLLAIGGVALLRSREEADASPS